MSNDSQNGILTKNAKYRTVDVPSANCPVFVRTYHHVLIIEVIIFIEDINFTEKWFTKESSK